MAAASINALLEAIHELWYNLFTHITGCCSNFFNNLLSREQIERAVLYFRNHLQLCAAANSCHLENTIFTKL